MEVKVGDWVYDVLRKEDGSLQGKRWPIDDPTNKEELTYIEQLPQEVRKEVFGGTDLARLKALREKTSSDPVNGSPEIRIDPH